MIRIRQTARQASGCIVALVLAVQPVGAQSSGQAESPCVADSPMVWARVVMRRMCRLAENPEIGKATGADNPTELLDAVPDDILWRLSDTLIVDLFQVFAESLGSLDDDGCAAMYPGAKDVNWAQQIMVMASVADSSLSERWADMLEAWVWIAVGKGQLQPEAGAEDVNRFLQSQFRDLGQQELSDIAALARGEEMPEDRACRAVRRMYVQLARGNETIAGPAIRTLMRGQLPWAPKS